MRLIPGLTPGGEGFFGWLGATGLFFKQNVFNYLFCLKKSLFLCGRQVAGRHCLSLAPRNNPFYSPEVKNQ
jgi:hypothetical protein